MTQKYLENLIVFAYLYFNSEQNIKMINNFTCRVTSVALSHIYTFSTGKNFASSFKIRSKLAEFFKHVHPDQMHQAPTQVKQQNLRSLKNLNSYIDSVNQQKSIEAKLLKFYIAQKMNHKSRKFYAFSIQLPQIKANAISQPSKVQKLMQDIVGSLNKKFEESKNVSMNKKKGKQQQTNQDKMRKSPIKEETQQQRIQRLQQTIQPIKKQSKYKDDLMRSQLENTITAKYLQAEKDSLIYNLRKNVSFADTSTNKPMMWSRIAIEESGIYTDYQDILANLIDPKLIYFDQRLTEQQIQAFKNKILPGSIQRKEHLDSKIIAEVCRQMEDVDPPINLYVTNHYSGKQIPGFFSIPFNFRPKELESNFQMLKQQIIQQRLRFEEFYDYHKNLLQELRVNNNINIQFEQFKGNDDIWGKILMMKRLSRYNFREPTFFVPFDQENLDVFVQEYSLTPGKTVYEYKEKIIILVNFIESDMQDLLITDPQQKNSNQNAYS